MEVKEKKAMKAKIYAATLFALVSIAAFVSAEETNYDTLNSNMTGLMGVLTNIAQSLSTVVTALFVVLLLLTVMKFVRGFLDAILGMLRLR